MMKYIFKILLIGGFFFPEYSESQLVMQDKMVFKISRSVYSLNDLLYNHKQIQILKCIYPESLMVKIFAEQFKPSNQKYLSYRGEFSAADKKYYLSLVDFYKLFIYSRSQDIRVDSNIEKYFYLMAQRNNCSMKVFTETKSFEEKFRKLVELEVFIRSRFLPTEKNDRTTQADIDKAISASKSLLVSIGRQIEEEIYW